MAVKADIKFLDGSIHRCVGRIVDGKSVPWQDIEDLKDHIRYIQSKRGDDIKIVKIIS